MQAFIWESRNRFVDTDASGRIHYTALFRHFEAAEFEFLRAIGCPYTSFLSEGVGFPRVHVECDYLSALRCDGLILTACSVEPGGGTSVPFRFSLILEARAAANR